jgi:cytoskeletal protein CcmA (bactofilin family)
MALFGKDRERGDRSRALDPESLPPHGPAPREVEMFERERERATGDEPGTSAFLGKGSKVSGKLAFEGTVRIEGQIEGEIAAQDTLTIGESAVINAQITGTTVIIHGKVTGDVTARKRLEIRAPGKVFGNISAPSLVINEGVIFEGHCTMSATEPARSEKDRKLAYLSKEDRPEGAALKAHSELAK